MKKLLFIFLLITITASAQKKKTYTIYVNYPDYTLKADVLAEPLKKHAEKEIDYYWYTSNKIIHTRGGYEGKVLNGSYTSFYISGNLKEKGSYKNGMKHGEWTSWFENGNIREIILWKNGLKQGSVKSFDEQGNLLLVSQFKKGLLNGQQLIYEDNKLSSKKKFRRGQEIIPPVKKETKTNKDNSKQDKKSRTKLKTFFHKRKKENPAKSPAINTEKNTPLKKLKSIFRTGKKKQDTAAQNNKKTATIKEDKKNGK